MKTSGLPRPTTWPPRRASGEALLLLNADAWLEAGALDLLAGKLSDRPDVGLVAPRLRYPDGRRQFSWSPARGFVGEVLQKARNPFEAQAWAHGSLARWLARVVGPTWYTAACVMVRAEAFRAVGGFDESFFMYFEDVDLCLRLSRPPGGAWPRSLGLSFVTPAVLRAGARSTTSIGRRSFATIGSTGRSGKAASLSVACADDAEMRRWIAG